MKRRIVLLGPPAVGKGTQAELIASRYGYPITSPGAILREERKAGTPLGIEAERYTNQGKLIPDDMVVGLVRAWLDSHNGQFVFDGVPRSIGQADGLDLMLQERGTPLEVVLSLEADLNTLYSRVQHRVVCSACGRTLSIGLHVPSATVPCPVCGGALTKRADDTAEILSARLEEYNRKTLPLIEYYTERNLLRSVDSSRTPDLVFDSIRAILEDE